METNGRSRIESADGSIAIYHCVYAHEGFGTSAQILFDLVRDAQERFPGKKRLLYLDIDGHRNSEGGFDADMLELQTHFLTGFLGQFLTAFTAPFVKAKNSKPQNDDLPPELVIEDRRDGDK